MSIKISCLLGLAALALCACDEPVPREIVTVQFDPNDYNQDEVDDAGRSQCQAKGFRSAIPYYRQPNMSASPWGYRNYACY